MSIHYGHHGDYVSSLVAAANSEIIFLSAFVTSPAIESLFAHCSGGIAITVVTRWSRADLELGSSDLGVFNSVTSRNGRLLRNQNLHAKLFMFDKEAFCFGSANLTLRGLGLESVLPNIECLSTATSVGPYEMTFVNNVLRHSQLVDQALVNELEKQLTHRGSVDFDESAIDKISHVPKGIFVGDFPFSSDPALIVQPILNAEAEHDRLLFCETITELSMQSLRSGFSKSFVMSWLRNECPSSMSFGALSKQIHDSILDDPKPYRKDIKLLQQNLITWIKVLLSDEFRVEVPPGGHSQILTRL